MPEDIRLKTSWRSHPKRKLLENIAGPQGLVSIIDLWLFCACHKTNGDLSGMSDLLIEGAATWIGEKGKFISACIESGLIDGDEFSRSIHDWANNQPWIAGHDLRSAKNRVSALKRHGHTNKEIKLIVKSMESARASRMRHACATHAKSNNSHAKSNNSHTPIPIPIPSPMPSPLPKNIYCGDVSSPPVDVGDKKEIEKDAMPPKEHPRSLAIRRVFEYYKTKHPRSFPSVSPNFKEWKLIEARMKEGITEDHLKEAIDGIHTISHNLGDNERGKKYLDLELIVRDSAHVEKYRAALHEKTANKYKYSQG